MRRMLSLEQKAKQAEVMRKVLKKKYAKMTKKQRSQQGRDAVNARWEKYRELQAIGDKLLQAIDDSFN